MKHLKAGVGFLVGFALCALWVLSMWVVRPLIFPRHGEWESGRYYVGEVECGQVISFFAQDGWDALSTPPIWVGISHYDTFRTEAGARAAVEKACR
ncbi:MAG: hypothetical protein WBQ94_03710 [Terracidiphilus sp.]